MLLAEASGWDWFSWSARLAAQRGFYWTAVSLFAFCSLLSRKNDRLISSRENLSSL